VETAVHLGVDAIQTRIHLGDPVLDAGDIQGYCRYLATAAQQWNHPMNKDLVNSNQELAKQRIGAAPAATVPVPSCTQGVMGL
jgi:hypothetical protein